MALVGKPAQYVLGGLVPCFLLDDGDVLGVNFLQEKENPSCFQSSKILPHICSQFHFQTLLEIDFLRAVFGSHSVAFQLNCLSFHRLLSLRFLAICLGENTVF